MKKICESVPALSIGLFVAASYMISICMEMAPYVSMAGVGVLIIAVLLWIINLVKFVKEDRELVQKGIRHQAGEAGIDSKLGKKLVTVKTARGKVILATVFQVLALVYALGIIFLIVWSQDGFGSYMPVFMVIALLLGLLPLRCWNDRMEIYENGISFCGDIYLYEEVGYPRFCRVSGRGMNMMRMELDGFCENVSYLKKVSEQYTKAYMKHV